MGERAESLRMADAAVSHARMLPVDPVDGQPAERYVIKTEDFMAVGDSYRIAAELESLGLRLHKPAVSSLAVVFFDVAAGTQEKLSNISVPQGWKMAKLEPLAP